MLSPAKKYINKHMLIFENIFVMCPEKLIFICFKAAFFSVGKMTIMLRWDLTQDTQDDNKL